MGASVAKRARRAAKGLKTRIDRGPVFRYLRGRSNRRRSQSPFFQTYPARFDEADVEGRALISRERKYVFSRIPKAANTTAVASLMRSEGEGDTSVESVERFKRCSPRLTQMSTADVDAIAQDYFKFTLVRNPYARVLSAYLDKIVRNKREAVHVREFMGCGSAGVIRFPDFLDYLEFGEGWRDDAHWARQSDLLCMPAAQMDYVARVETIDTDLPRILGAIYGTRAEILTVSPHATRAADQVAQLPGDELTRIRRIYAPDFDVLRYPTAPV